MSRRQAIMEAMMARMQSLTKDNGHPIDAGHFVFDWLGRPLKETERPSIHLRDVKDEIDSSTPYTYKHSLTVHILLSLAKGEETMVLLRQLMADISQVMASDDEKFPPLEYRELKKTEMDVDEQGAIVGGALMEWVIYYQTPAFEM